MSRRERRAARRAGRPEAARRRSRRLAVVMALVVAAAGGGWVVGSRVRSPAAAAAERKPPVPSPITVPVEKRALSNDLTRRGSVRFDQVTPLTLAGAVGGESGGAQVVTRVPGLGDELTEGGTVLEVNGRPVFVLQGAQPTYRTLTPGAKGKDVEQLEAALARLGFDPGAQDGVYDAATQAAVQQLYESKGYTAQGPSSQEQTALREARKAAADAADRVREATKALAEAGKGPSGADLLSMQNDIKQATQGVEAAKADAARADAEAAAAVTARAAEVEAAKLAAVQAADALATATRTGQDPVDPTRPCDAACRTRLQAEVDARNAAVTAAAGALDTAKAAVAATAARNKADVTRAEDQLALAHARLADAKAPRDTSAAAKNLEAAKDAAAQAASEEAALEARTGTVVPAGEVLFLPELPRRIDSVKAKVGDAVSAEFATASGSNLAIDSSVDAADAGKLKLGMKVQVRLTDIDRRLEGTIDAIAEKPGTNGAPSGQVYVRVKPDDLADAAQLNGLGVVVTIPLQSTNGKEVLTVPVAAISTRADGTSWLRVLDGTTATAAERDVQVQVGLQGQGVVEVNPMGGARLAAGDRVAVGEKGSTDA